MTGANLKCNWQLQKTISLANKTKIETIRENVHMAVE